MPAPPLTAARLREVVILRDGELHWRSLDYPRKPGPIGHTDSKGYRKTKIDGHAYAVHRLMWLWHYGDWPKGDIDHADGNPANNDITNLRDYTRSQNVQNSARRGVVHHRNKIARQWSARIYVDGQVRHLGYFATEAEAHGAYLAAKLEYHAPWATGRGRVA
jgi:hypothetical protein